MSRLLSAACGCTALLMHTVAFAQSGDVPDWVYGDGELPEKWSVTNEAYGACDAGAMQSPIDLAETNARGDISLSASYGVAEGKLKLGPRKVQVDVGPGMGMISGERLYSLLQMHFHTPAEHVLHDKRYPLVVHLVHGSQKGHFAVLGVAFEEGEANPALQPIIDAMEANRSAFEFDVAKLVPDDLSVYRYMGSLTTPPCTEGVNWHVADNVLTASPEQIAMFVSRLGNSNRSLQPVNNRLVVGPEG